MKNSLYKRKGMERRITLDIVSNPKSRIYKVGRGHNGRILSFSPYMARENTNLFYEIEEVYYYSGLSRAVHKNEYSPRNEIERKIREMVYLDNHPHLVFPEIDSYSKYRQYCNINKIPLISKEKYNTLQKLIIKWKILSAKEHYAPTKQEKRKIKKLNKRRWIYNVCNGKRTPSLKRATRESEANFVGPYRENWNLYHMMRKVLL